MRGLGFCVFGSEWLIDEMCVVNAVGGFGEVEVLGPCLSRILFPLCFPAGW